MYVGRNQAYYQIITYYYQKRLICIDDNYIPYAFDISEVVDVDFFRVTWYFFRCSCDWQCCLTAEFSVE